MRTTIYHHPCRDRDGRTVRRIDAQLASDPNERVAAHQVDGHIVGAAATLPYGAGARSRQRYRGSVVRDLAAEGALRARMTCSRGAVGSCFPQ